MRVVAHAVVREVPEGLTAQDLKAQRRQSRAARLAVHATREVIAKSGWQDPSEVGQFMGVGASGGREEDLAQLLRHGMHRANPLLAFQLMNNFSMVHAAIDAGLGGPNQATFSKGAGTVFALIAALSSGVERLIVGGTDCGSDPVTRHKRRHAGYAGELTDAAAVLALAKDAEGPSVVEARFIGRAEPPRFHSDWVGHRTGAALAVDAALGWLEALNAIEAGAKTATSVILDGDGQCGWVTFGSQVAPKHSRVNAVSVRSMGVVSPFGMGPKALVDGLLSERMATTPVRRFDTTGLAAGVASQVPPDPVVDRERDRKIGMVRAAASQLAGVRPEAWIHLAVGLEAAHLEDFSGMVTEGGIDWHLATEHHTFRTDLDTCAWELSKILGTAGPVTVDVSACAAGGLSLLTAKMLLDTGRATQVVCGAVDAMVNPLGYGGMARLGAMSPRGRARPFDVRRDGLVMGEGCALFVLERGTGGLGTLLGAASTQDGYKVTAPRPNGVRAAAAIRRALRSAGVDAVTWVNAHGTGTMLNDPAERRALDLAGITAPVRSLKGAIGHGMAAAGAIEAAATWLFLERGVVPSTMGLERIDPACEGPEIPCDNGTVLSTSFGFGGQNVALVLGGA